MKTKNTRQKLMLKKETVTHLNNVDLGNAKGGYSAYQCETREITDCRTVCVTYCLACQSIIETNCCD